MNDTHVRVGPGRSLTRNLAAGITALMLLVALCLTIAGRIEGQAAAAPAAPSAHPAAATPQPQPYYGVNFISSAEERAPGSGRNPASLERQYQNGLATGATWNRWPLYWFNIEQSRDNFNWSAQDATIQSDIAHGLQLNAILLGTPPFYTTGQAASSEGETGGALGDLGLAAADRATPVGLYEPVFSDGSDLPGPGKRINEANKWARFVWLAVNRYKPGGQLAQANGWPAGVGVTHWAMWNEPDLNSFWDTSLEDFARLQKVGYMAAKQADPSAQVIFGALANNVNKPNYYRDVLAIYAADPLAAGFNFYHDILATHSYFHAWKSFYHVFRARRAMDDWGLHKPIWLDETGVPAWNDYPGPVWDPKSALRATTQEQADYAIQSAFYALYAGAQAVFHFQLYDGCGNQPQGTDFPPHNGELCDANGELIGRPGFPCAGDANGLYRNPTDAACFRQHPQPESPRPNQAAFRVLTTHVRDVQPYWRKRVGEPDACPDQLNPSRRTAPQEWIALYRTASQERLVAMWTLCDRRETAVIEAASPTGRATLVYPDGRTESIIAAAGVYTISLPPATNRNPFGGEGVNALFPIGGRPVILIEYDDGRPPDMSEESFLPAVMGRLSGSQR